MELAHATRREKRLFLHMKWSVCFVLFVTALVVVATGELYMTGAGEAYIQIRNAIYGEVPLRDLRRMLLVLLKALEESKREYWLDAGTMLGVHREGDLIAGDRDADLGMLVHEAQRMWGDLKLQNALVAEGYKLVRSRNNNYRVYPISEKCVHLEEQDAMPDNCLRIDISQYKVEGACAVRDCFFHDWAFSCDPEVRGKSMYRNHIFPVQHRNVEAWNMSVQIPANPDDFLSYVYGPSWRKPRPWGSHLKRGCKS